MFLYYDLIEIKNEKLACCAYDPHYLRLIRNYAKTQLNLVVQNIKKMLNQNILQIHYANFHMQR